MRPRRFVTLIATLIALIGLYTSSPAFANGRFPKAQVIVTVPGSNGDDLYMRSTFGILVSHDAGKTWAWVCEQTFGYQGTWDPPVAATRDGRLWVGKTDGLVSTVGGCGSTEEPALAGETIKDLTVDASGQILFALTATEGKTAHVWRREKDGTWKKLGAGYPDMNFMTLEVAPSKISRVYVTGQPTSTVRGQIFKSDDGGATFTIYKNDLPDDGPFFIAAVDPKNPDHLVLRHLHFKGSDIYVSTDGGKTIHRTLHLVSAMYGFAKSDDGKILWEGSGLARDGIMRSTDGGEHWEQMGNFGVLCLHAVKDLLFQCGNAMARGGTALAVSRDQGKTMTQVSTFAAVGGPIACDGGATQACVTAWPETSANLLPTQVPTSAPDSGAQIYRGEDGGARPSGSTRSGCNCSETARDRMDKTWIIGVLLPLVLWGRRRTGPRRSRAAWSTIVPPSERLRASISPRTSDVQRSNTAQDAL